MGHWADRLGLVVMNGALSGGLAVAVLSLALVVCRQPARRLQVVRWGLVGLIAMVPLTLSGGPWRIELWSLVAKAGLVGPLTARWLELASSRWLAVGYGVGVAVSLAWLALGYFALHRLARRSTAPSPKALAVYQGARQGRRSGGGALQFRASEKARGPILVGPLRPTIVVPVELDPPVMTAESELRLRLVLLHELAHHEGRDPLFLLVGRVAQTFWWFLPPLWWALARMRVDQEVIADRKAAADFGLAGDYASSLLGLASGPPTGASEAPRPATPSLDPVSPLHERLLMLVRTPFPVEPSPPRWWSWGLPLAIAAVVMGASSLVIVPVWNHSKSSQGLALKPRRSFAMSRLELGPSAPLPNGRAPRYELPLRLPRHFELSVDVHASPWGLALTRIAGLALSTGPRRPGSGPDDAPESWHRVRFIRGPEGDRLWVDDRPVSAANERDPAPVWLTLEPPPGFPGLYRNLILRW